MNVQREASVTRMQSAPIPQVHTTVNARWDSVGMASILVLVSFIDLTWENFDFYCFLLLLHYVCAQGKWPFQPELIVVSIVWSNKKSYYSPLVTHRDEKLLPSRGKSCYPWGKSCYFQGGRVVTFKGEELLPSGRRVVALEGRSCYPQEGKSCYPRGEEFI